MERFSTGRSIAGLEPGGFGLSHFGGQGSEFQIDVMKEGNGKEASWGSCGLLVTACSDVRATARCGGHEGVSDDRSSE